MCIDKVNGRTSWVTSLLPFDTLPIVQRNLDDDNIYEKNKCFFHNYNSTCQRWWNYNSGRTTKNETRLIYGFNCC